MTKCHVESGMGSWNGDRHAGEAGNPAEVSALVNRDASAWLTDWPQWGTDAGVSQQGPVWGPRTVSPRFLSL